MRIEKHTTTTGQITGYTLWLSAVNTSRWAHRPGSVWPCSCLSGKSLRLDVDDNGLSDITVNGRRPDSLTVAHDGPYIDRHGTELAALVSDYLPDDCKHLWPCWGNTQ